MVVNCLMKQLSNPKQISFIQFSQNIEFFLILKLLLKFQFWKPHGINSSICASSILKLYIYRIIRFNSQLFQIIVLIEIENIYSIIHCLNHSLQIIIMNLQNTLLRLLFSHICIYQLLGLNQNLLITCSYMSTEKFDLQKKYCRKTQDQM
ncbi:unnamed protein product [Paramecium octaurelia]|uniref:Uncharacterized protein n=1 Tax=Paramecium octaurelia TaxID=43137 RepID=A0A8S1VXM4_PAROT|nr:unnamed protein product [Paramecium octaurelia]